MVIVPPPYSPRGIDAGEIRVVHRVILGLHRQPVLPGVGGMPRGHGPGHQHAVALQPEVVVQPPGVMLLDDEGVVVAVRARYRARAPAPVSGRRIARRGTCPACRPLIAVLRPAADSCRTRRSATTGTMPTAGIACCAGARRRRCHRIPGPAWDPAPRRAARAPRGSRRCRRSGSASSSQVRGAATVGWSRPRSEYGAMVVFDAVVLRPVDEDLPWPQHLAPSGTSPGRACPASIASAISLATADASSDVRMPSSRLYR